MSENKRFKWEDVYKWGVPAFLEVMNGLDKKNQQLKQENKQLKQSYQVLADMCDDYLALKDSLEKDNEQLKKEIKYLQSELHNATFNIRKNTLKEVKMEIEKLERWE